MSRLPVQQNAIHPGREGKTGSVGTRKVNTLNLPLRQAVFAIATFLEISNIEITFTSSFVATFKEIVTYFAQSQNAFGHSLDGGFKYAKQFFFI